MKKQLTLIMALFVIVLVALLYLVTIGEREISSEAIEEILASRSSSKSEVPDVSHTLLRSVSTAIAEEINKTDEHRKDRVDDLLVALKESPSLQRDTISKSKCYIQSATCNELHYYKPSVVVTYGLRIGMS